MSRLLLRLAATVLGLAALFALTLALPVPSWRHGRLELPPLVLQPAAPPVHGSGSHASPRVWVDTDAACGAGARTDPDDCFALALILRSAEVDVVGVSTVFGNAALAVTDSTTRALASVLTGAPGAAMPVHEGAAVAPGAGGRGADTQANVPLRRALEEGPLTIIALGPLTNVAAALDGRPDLQRNVAQLISVMGRRPGHIFHPAEGARSGLLLGHGPVFRDLNFALDPRAAAAILAMGLEVTLVPYDAARRVEVTSADLDRIEAAGPAMRWIVSRSRGWLGFWRDEIGRDGFYPFDLVASALLLAPHHFACATAWSWIGPDRTLWHRWFHSPDALLVGGADDVPKDAAVRATLRYCPQAAPGLHDWLVDRLAGRPTPRSAEAREDGDDQGAAHHHADGDGEREAGTPAHAPSRRLANVRRRSPSTPNTIDHAISMMSLGSAASPAPSPTVSAGPRRTRLRRLAAASTRVRFTLSPAASRERRSSAPCSLHDAHGPGSRDQCAPVRRGTSPQPCARAATAVVPCAAGGESRLRRLSSSTLAAARSLPYRIPFVASAKAILACDYVPVRAASFFYARLARLGMAAQAGNIAFRHCDRHRTCV